jgi:segregation and condensation protein B
MNDASSSAASGDNTGTSTTPAAAEGSGSATIHLAAQDPADIEDAAPPETPADEPAPVEPPADDATDIQALTGHEPGPNGDGAQDEDDEPLPPPSESAQQEITPEQIVEAILFSADTAMTLPKIVSILGVGSARDVRKYIESLNARYEKAGLSFRIEKIAGGYRMLSLPVYNTWLRRLHQSHQDSRLSQAALETLAVVAYKQPVVRAEVEAIRGVSAGEMLNRLRELGLIKIVGRAEDVGRPILYGTTKRFLEVFGLGSLEDLPAVEELKAPE